MDEEFPVELLVQILIRLPVLSLIRFMSVSRSWYELICSYDFINKHLNYNHNQVSDNYNVLFTVSNGSNETYTLHADTVQMLKIENYPCPLNDYRLFGSVNGLISLAKIDMVSCSNSIMLWNPTIRRYYRLPELINREPLPNINVMNIESCVSDVNFGFGYDNLSNDFKVVRMIVFKMKSDPPLSDAPSNDISSLRAVFTVFSLRKASSWKPLKNCTPMHLISNACTLGHFVYRLALIPGSDPKVVSFDFNTDEVFTEIDFPKDDKYVPITKAELTDFQGSLGLLHRVDGMRYNLWVLQKDGEATSWRKLTQIQLNGPCLYISGYTRNGLAAMVEHYCPPGEDLHRSCQHAWQAIPFKACLALMHEGVDY